MKQSSGHFESNSQPILTVLKLELPENASVLELASGPGQHAAFFAEQLATTKWQPSEIDTDYLPSLCAYVDDAKHHNMLTPLEIDACGEWPIEKVDAIVAINLLHVSSWQVCVGVLKNASRVLPENGLVFFYGPFIRPDVETAPSNLMFNMRLQQRDPDWGVPDLVAVCEEAKKYGLSLKAVHDLPSNNVMVVLHKQ